MASFFTKFEEVAKVIKHDHLLKISGLCFCVVSIITLIIPINESVILAKEACSGVADYKFWEKPNPEQAKIVAAELTSLTESVVLTHMNYYQAKTEDKAPELRKLAAQRKLALIETMRRNPEAALSSLLPQEERIALEQATQNCVEQYVTLEGSLEVVHVDFFEEKTSITQYTLITDSNDRVVLHSTRGFKDPLESRTKVRVTGFRIDGDLLFDGLSSMSQPLIEQNGGIEVISQPGNPPVLGAQRTLVILANFADYSVSSPTKAEVTDFLATKLAPYYAENSYNRMNVTGVVNATGDVFGWYTMPVSRSCGTNIQAVINAADADVYFPDYKRLLVVAPYGPNCWYSGQASLGAYSFTTNDGPVSLAWGTVVSSFGTNLYTMGHEYGHGFGNNHARFLDCGNVAIADSGCYAYEYGDRYDIMGGDVGHFNAPHKEYVGWLEASNITTISTDGVYVLEPFETATGGLKSLKIRRGVSDYLYIEYRKPIGFDANFGSVVDVYQGASLHVTTYGPYYPYLIDATPPASATTPALKPGMTFTDPKTNSKITVLTADSTSLTVNIILGQTDFDGPTVAITSPQAGAILSGPVTVSAVATDPSGVVQVTFDFGVRQIIDTDAPYSATFDTTQIPNGSNETIIATAVDIFGNSSTSFRLVTIANTDSIPPTVTSTSPGNGAEVTNPVFFSANASDNVGVWYVEWWLDGFRWINDTTAPYEISGPVLLANGLHTVFTKALDFVGNSTSSPVTSFTVGSVASPSPSPTPISTPTPTPSTQTLIPLGSTWKYLDNNTRPAGWETTSFVDTTWKTGASELGYGDGDEATVVSYGSNSAAKYITTYFRKGVSVTSASSFTKLDMTVERDDGVVVYLNGVEVHRGNMPTGTISQTTLASSAIEDTTTTVSVNPALLREGTNVIAAEIHQGSAGSSDISFNLSLIGSTISPPPPPPPSPSPTPTPIPTPSPTPTPTPKPDITLPTVSITSPTIGTTVPRNSRVTIAASAADNVGVSKVEFRVNGSIVCTDLTQVYTCAWNVPAKPSVTYKIEARAYDTSNNYAYVTISVKSSQ